MRKLRTSLWCTAAVWFVFTVLSTPGYADDAQALMDRLHRVSDATSLDAPGVAPWHLKLTVQLDRTRSGPAEQGTIEEWWAAPGLSRITYDFPSYKATQLTANGQALRTTGVGTAPPMLLLLLRQAVHPMASEQDISESKPELREEKFGSSTLECIMLGQPLRSEPHPTLGHLSTFCMEAGKDSLRASYQFGQLWILRNNTGTFQKHSVSTQFSITLSGEKAASAQIALLKTESLTADDFTPKQESFSPIAISNPFITSSAAVGSRIITSVTPIYPPQAKSRGVSGSVLLWVTIGRDGRVGSMRLIGAPEPTLAAAASDAVRQWVYTPYLLNGKPTEVDTVITVNFGFSR